MKGTSRQSVSSKPVAILIAAQMRIAMPKAVQPHQHMAVSVKAALKKAANSSPAAKAAFKRAAPAVKAATPHLKALAQQPGKGLLSSLRHGVSAMRSLRQVTREMTKESPSVMNSAQASFKEAAASSPAAKTAFKRAGPATAQAHKHVDALSRLQQQPNPSLLSSLGHGIQAMRALRSVTKEMNKASPLSPLLAKSALAEAKASSPKVAQAFKQAAPSVARAGARLDALAQIQQQSKPSLLSSLGQGFQALRALHGVTQAMKANTQPVTTASLPPRTIPMHGVRSSHFEMTPIVRKDDSAPSGFAKKK